MSSPNPIRFAIGGVAAVVVAFGAYALGNSNSGKGRSGTANAAQAAPAGQPPREGRLPLTGHAPPGMGAPAGGAAAARARAAALAKYKGTVEQVMKLGDGSYVVHVITPSGEYHVFVSNDFKVTGADQSGPGGPGPGGAHGSPSAGARPQGGRRAEPGATN